MNGFGYKNFIDFVRHNKQELTISIPHISYLRGNVFISDLRDNFPGEVPFSFDIGHLIFLLYDDFLEQIKRGAENKEIAAFLLKGRQQYLVPTKEKKVMKNVSKNLFTFESEYVEEEQEGEVAELYIRMRESEIMRGEIMIHDIQEHLKGVQLTIEDILVIRYMEFITGVKKNGNSLQVQKAILSKIG